MSATERLLGREELRALLIELGRRCAAKGLEVEMYVVGGAAMALAHGRQTPSLISRFDPRTEAMVLPACDSFWDSLEDFGGDSRRAGPWRPALTCTFSGGGGSGPAPDHQVQTRRSRWSRGLPYAAARAVALLNFGPDVPSREKRRAFCYPGGRYYRWYEYDRSTWCATREHGHSPRHGDNRIFGTHSFSGGPDGARSRCRAACS